MESIAVAYYDKQLEGEQYLVQWQIDRLAYRYTYDELQAELMSQGLKCGRGRLVVI